MVSAVSGTFPCPLCLAGLTVRGSKKGKPYLVCDRCGLQMFVRTTPGIERLSKLVADLKGQGVMERLTAFEHQNRKRCPACNTSFWVFRKLGFIDYGSAGLKVHDALLSVVLYETLPSDD